MAQAKQFAKADVNYFGVGPVYATLTKPETAPALGLKKLREISEILPKPVVAIGGITKNNVIDVLRTGVSGVAIISAIFSQACPLQAVKNFQNLIYKM
jgi:thiamine-phosphate pyrophosphorylase